MIHLETAHERWTKLDYAANTKHSMISWIIPVHHGASCVNAQAKTQVAPKRTLEHILDLSLRS